MIQLSAFAMIVIAATATPATPAGERVPGWLGMGYVWSSNATGQKTLVIQQLAPGGPAASAGVKTGDIITTINERRVDFGDDLDLLLFLGDRKPGDRLVFGVVREGREQKIRVKLGTMPDASRAAWKQNLEVARRKRLAAAQGRQK
jgi:S1-C subfamily serine protease